jgi:hypothetical protein
MVAVPVASTVPTPIEIESSEKVTKPVGGMEPPLEIVAEITTGVRVGSGLWLAEMVVVVGDCNTVIAIVCDLLVTSFESPL